MKPKIYEISGLDFLRDEAMDAIHSKNSIENNPKPSEQMYPNFHAVFGMDRVHYLVTEEIQSRDSVYFRFHFFQEIAQKPSEFDKFGIKRNFLDTERIPIKNSALNQEIFALQLILGCR